MRIDLETGLFTSEQHSLYEVQGIYYDDDGIQTGDYREAVILEVPTGERSTLRVPLRAVTRVRRS